MGSLYIVSTPIGNLEDITIRALKTLGSVNVIACEDTRVTGLLLSELTKRYPEYLSHLSKPTFISYRDANEQSVAPQLIARLLEGDDVALVSDAGTPLISDPGLRIVQAARKHGIPVIAVPGPSAFVTGLSSSGFPAHSVVFLGFLPDKRSHRIKLFGQLSSMSGIRPFTYCYYVSPHDLKAVLSDMREALGDIPITCMRELTKLHEEAFTGSVSTCIEHFDNPKGEFVVLFQLS